MAVVLATVAACAATKLLCYHFYAHRTGSALDALNCRFETCGIQIGHLLLGYIRNLLFGDLANLVLIRRSGALGNGRGSLQQHRCRGRLGDESERPIRVDRNDYWDDQSFLILTAGLGVELLAELHDVDLRLTERGTYRRSRSRFASSDLEFDLCLYFFWWCHCLNLAYS